MQKKLFINLFIGALCICGVFTSFDRTTISYSERRKLVTFPFIVEDGKWNADFFTELETYLNDHFMQKDMFRKAKSLTARDVLLMQDENGIYCQKETLFAMEDRVNEKSVKHFNSIVHKVQKNVLEGYPIYLSLIPRKNEYVEKKDHPEYSFSALEKKIDMQGMQYIPIRDLLQLDSYYRTDIHWRQDKIEKVAKRLVEDMGYTFQPLEEMQRHSFDSFHGALYARTAAGVAPDELCYLDSPYFDTVQVYSLEKNKDIPVYDVEALHSIDAYNVFVDGPSAYLDIENPNVESGSLILFRDSFGSSLLPLLIPSFHHIQVIDLRYYSSKFLDRLSLDKDASVLFLYGSEILNNSLSLK